MRMIGWLALALAAAEEPVEVPSPYRRSVELIERSYMYPEGVTPQALLGAAAEGAELGIDWLYTDVDGGHVVLRHANGRAIGEVSVEDWAGLPAALYGMESQIDAAGIGYGKVDLRLTVLSGMTTVLDDYSRFLAGDKLDSFDTRLKGTLVGIGATMRRVEDKITVVELVEDGPAARVGMRPGDVLVRIADVRTTNLPLKEAVRLIRGEAGTQLTIDVLRDGAPLSFVMAREAIIIENVAHEVLEGDVGYIRIDNVSQQTVRNMARALADLRGRGALDRGLVLDLRGNTGGSMKESAGVVDQLVRAGLVITTVGPDGRPIPDLIARLDTRADGNEPDVPLVVLVDPATASGAEIIAGSLQELGRAVLVGRRTFGKGQVQKVYTLDEGLSFKMTVAEYRLAHERPVAGVGIQPDVHVGHISVGTDATRISGWDPEREKVPWSAILPAVAVTTEGATGNQDVERELARQAVLRTTSGAREHVLAAVTEVAAELRGAQEQRLQEAMVARGIDWAPSPGDGAAPEVRVSLEATPADEDPELHVVRATVRNDGPTPLHRATLRLRCDSYGAWDDLLLPIGLLPSGAEVVVESRVKLAAGVEPRQDPVSVEVHADRRPDAVVDGLSLHAATTRRPRVRVASHLVQDEAGQAVALTITNLSEEDIEGLDAWFEAPYTPGVELVDSAARVDRVEAGASVELRLALRVAEDGPTEVPLELVIECDRFGTLFRPDLLLPISGTEEVREAPTVEAGRHPLVARAGRFVLPLEVADDDTLTSVVVFANRQKVLWDEGGADQVRLRPTFELVAGQNVVTVVAVDNDGTRLSRTFRIFGEGDGHAERQAAPPEVEEAPPGGRGRKAQPG